MINDSLTRFVSSVRSFKYLCWIILSISLVVGFFVYYFVPNLTHTVIDQTGLSRIVPIFVIANSLFSLIIPIAIKREALRNRKHDLIFSLSTLWASVFLILFEFVRGEPFYFFSYPDFPNPFTRFAIIIWGVGIFYLLKTTFATLSIDTIKFKKNGLTFEHNDPTKWGIKFIDDRLSKIDKDIYFPIMILGDETSRPWKILLRFVLSGLIMRSKNNADNKKIETGAIYFTFTRPASEIKEMLTVELGRMKDENQIVGNYDINWSHMVFIDCYTLKPAQKLWNKDMIPSSLYYADSYNPHEINKKYEEALKKLSDLNCGHVRVVYDAISDFLKFTDFRIATQYLRQNMGFEQRKHVESLYLFRMGTMAKTDEEYVLWFANGLLKMKQETDSTKKNVLAVEFNGPFREPQKFHLDYEYNPYTFIPSPQTGNPNSGNIQP